MIPLISFDAVVNVYLTILFLIPLQSKHSFVPLSILLIAPSICTRIGLCLGLRLRYACTQ